MFRGARQPQNQNNIKPTRENIKELLQKARTTHQNHKNTLQQLMARDVQTNALLQSQANKAQSLWTDIERIKSGNVGPEMENLKNEFIGFLREGLSTGVITDIEKLARLEATELEKFMGLLTKKRNGLAFSFIDRLPVFKFDMQSRPNESICAICHDDYAEGEDCIELDCKHIFHKKCISKWLEQKRTCPMCKKQVKAEERPREGDENVSRVNVMGRDLRPERRP